jgi:hypothetical protein
VSLTSLESFLPPAFAKRIPRRKGTQPPGRQDSWDIPRAASSAVRLIETAESKFRAMAPAFLEKSFKELRRRSRASFRTEHSTDTLSEGAQSHGTAPSSGSLTPPSIAQQSDPALNLQVKEPQVPPIPPQHRQQRPALSSGTSSKRNSVSGMSSPGSPSARSSILVSQYAPKISNVQENAWVRHCALSPSRATHLHVHFNFSGFAVSWLHLLPASGPTTN